MSAKRYSGDVNLTITYRDREDDYKVAISAYTDPKTKYGQRAGFKSRTTTIYVGRLPTQSVDNPDTIDSVAHAALSFAYDEDPDSVSGAAMDDAGWTVSRSPHMRWGGPLHAAAVKKRSIAARRSR